MLLCTCVGQYDLYLLKYNCGSDFKKPSFNKILLSPYFPAHVILSLLSNLLIYLFAYIFPFIFPLFLVLRCCSVSFQQDFSAYLAFSGIVLHNAQLYETSQLENRRNQVCANVFFWRLAWTYSHAQIHKWCLCVCVCVCRCCWTWPVWSLRSSSVWRFYWERLQEPSCPSCRPRLVPSSSLTRTQWSAHTHTNTHARNMLMFLYLVCKIYFQRMQTEVIRFTG